MTNLCVRYQQLIKDNLKEVAKLITTGEEISPVLTSHITPVMFRAGQDLD